MEKPAVPHSVWVTTLEFSRMMGKSYRWAVKGVHSGLFSEAGIPILTIARLSGKGKCQFFFNVPSDL